MREIYACPKTGMHWTYGDVAQDGQTMFVGFKEFDEERGVFLQTRPGSESFKDPEYLGDGVYCGHDTYQLWVWTSDGITEKNFVAFEPKVFNKLIEYDKRLRQTLGES